MSTQTAPGIDLDAAIRESLYPEGIPVPYKGTTYVLPAELPLDVLDPLLDPEFDLIGLLKLAVDGDDDADLGEVLIDVLFKRPGLPLEIRDTIFGCLQLLFGEEQWKQFQSNRPGLTTIATLIKGIFKVYGVSLGEAFASLSSSVSDGATPNQTSNATTALTPDTSSDDLALEPASSESDVSATS